MCFAMARCGYRGGGAGGLRDFCSITLVVIPMRSVGGCGRGRGADGTLQTDIDRHSDVGRGGLGVKLCDEWVVATWSDRSIGNGWASLGGHSLHKAYSSAYPRHRDRASGTPPRAARVADGAPGGVARVAFV